ELERLQRALGPTRLAIEPTPSWLPRQLVGPILQVHDVVGYVPHESLSLAWLDWLASLGPRESKQLLIPLGVPAFELEPYAVGLEPATAAHARERLGGPLFPDPDVLALLYEGVRAPEGKRGDRDLDEAARELWEQARRALPRYGELIGMREPSPMLSLQRP